MAGLTIRNLDEPLKKRLRIQAAHNGRSMEEEVRQILRHVLDAGLPTPELLPPQSAAIAPSPPQVASTGHRSLAAPLTATDAWEDRPTVDRPSPMDRLVEPDDGPFSQPTDDVAASMARLPATGEGTAPTSAAAATADQPSPSSRSVEAFTDGLRQRLALLVGVDAVAAPRS